MASIFVSYAREDLGWVNHLCEVLKAHDFDVWQDVANLRVGSVTSDAIQHAINQASCVIVIWSKFSVRSKWVEAEASEALRLGKLCPVAIDDTRPPLPFGTINTRILSSSERRLGISAYERLLGDIRLCSGSPRSTSNREAIDHLASGEVGPELVYLPAGSFKIGSPSSEKGHREDEHQREATVGEFLIGRYPVTFRDYDLYCESSKHEIRPRPPYDYGWGRDKRPVIDVTFTDAVGYVEWLCRETGKLYRLPSELEWEYAVRAGTQTRYWWGESVHEDGGSWANCRGCNAHRMYGQTTPTGTFPKNRWGLYDMVGNVWEMTSSFYDGGCSASESGPAGIEDPRPRVMRGGSWNSDPLELRSARRRPYFVNERKKILGFRLVREP